uniref:Uncharacterized protein n=1 Tax=Dromaius novaehollandiae TaxID=8790 RepID=A0A8C4KDQ3_DRONO
MGVRFFSGLFRAATDGTAHLQNDPGLEIKVAETQREGKRSPFALKDGIFIPTENSCSKRVCLGHSLERREASWGRYKNIGILSTSINNHSLSLSLSLSLFFFFFFFFF